MLFKKFLFLKKNLPEVIFIIAALAFSCWLMFASFGYDSQAGTILIGSKLWSDFGAHLPLIRSFSWGKNFPPEYPLFPGEPIRYHFLFYALVGFLEKVGLPLDWALNLPSAITLALLLFSIYFLAITLFGKRSIALLSVIFFLFNSSFSFLEFFKNNSLSKIFTIDNYPSFGPYDGKTVSAFWSLNIFINQRHLAFGFASILIIISLFIYQIKREKEISLKTKLFLGIFLGCLPLFHSAVFVMGLIIFSVLSLLLTKYRRSLLIILAISSLLGLPQLFFLHHGLKESIIFNPGYLIANNLSFKSAFSYWLLNLGLSCFLIPLGFLWTDRLAQKLILAFFSLFILGNLFQFSPEMAANHKFFNLFIIAANIYVAFAIHKIWQSHFLGKIAVPILIFFLTFSGVIDFFALKNSFFYHLQDQSPQVLWIKNNTSPDAVFITQEPLYHPASLAGRKLFLGWAYFLWSIGYNVNARSKTQEQILSSSDASSACELIRKHQIDYLSFQPGSNNQDRLEFWQKNFPLVFQTNSLSIFDLRQCQN